MINRRIFELIVSGSFMAFCGLPADADGPPPPDFVQDVELGDVAILKQMIHAREKAMIDHDIEAALSQFGEDATWVNSQGYYFVGREMIREFHKYLAKNADRDYQYVAGAPLIRLLDDETAIVYHGWRMKWHAPGDPATVIKDEVGIMSLLAQKRHEEWKWVAITVQHTPYFYEEIEPVTQIGD